MKFVVIATIMHLLKYMTVNFNKKIEMKYHGNEKGSAIIGFIIIPIVICSVVMLIGQISSISKSENVSLFNSTVQK